jgi:hypothetical protein
VGKSTHLGSYRIVGDCICRTHMDRLHKTRQWIKDLSWDQPLDELDGKVSHVPVITFYMWSRGPKSQGDVVESRESGCCAVQDACGESVGGSK